MKSRLMGKGNTLGTRDRPFFVPLFYIFVGTTGFLALVVSESPDMPMFLFDSFFFLAIVAFGVHCLGISRQIVMLFYYLIISFSVLIGGYYTLNSHQLIYVWKTVYIVLWVMVLIGFMRKNKGCFF